MVLVCTVCCNKLYSVHISDLVLETEVDLCLQCTRDQLYAVLAHGLALENLQYHLLISLFI